MARSRSKFFVAGGTLRADALSYVERPADAELWDRLQDQDYCYILTSRQMGKSSLMARTLTRLRQDGGDAALVDLTRIGSQNAEAEIEKWYYGVVFTLHRELRIRASLKTWWDEHTNLSAVQRFVEYFREIVLPEISDRIVVFIDEIDSTIGKPFADEFFAAIRACYNARASEALFEKLTFVLIGVATPDQLISDTAHTPFNVGQQIELTDFSLEEASALCPGLPGNEAERHAILTRILFWTGGQPYLTQFLCEAMVADQEEAQVDAEEWVDSLVERHFFDEASRREITHFKHAQARLTADAGKLQRLRLYRLILRGREIADEPILSVHASLKLSGVVGVSLRGFLKIRNRLYGEIFNSKWAQQEMPIDKGRMVAYGSLAALFLLVISWLTFILPQGSVEQLRLARDDYAVAAQAYQRLSSNPFFSQSKADRFLTDFWARRARHVAQMEDRDRSLLAWLQAMKISDSTVARKEAAHLSAQDYEHLRATLRHGDAVLDVEFSPDGQSVLTASVNTARLWRSDTGEPIGQAMQHEDVILSLAFSPDGRSIVTGSSDDTARLWRADTAESIGKPIQHGDDVNAVAFSPDGRTVATASSDNRARFWRTNTGELFGQPMQHGDDVNAIAFSPDGQAVVTGSSDNTARLWRADDAIPIGRPMQHEGSVFAVEFSPDGQSVVTASEKTAQLWQADTGEPIGQPMQHEESIYAVAFNPNGNSLITGSDDDTAQLWRADNGNPIGLPMQHLLSVSDVAFSPDGQTVFTGSLGGLARLWRADDGEPIGKPLYHGAFIIEVAFSPDGQSVATAGLDTTARIWRADISEQVDQSIQHWTSAFSWLDISPDWRTLVTVNSHTARLWHTETGKPIGQPIQHGGEVSDVDFSPDGRFLITGGEDGSARIWRAEDGEPVGQPIYHRNSVSAVAFSLDGRLVSTGGEDGSARLWQSETGEPVGQPMYHRNSVDAMTFSPDGALLVTRSDDNTAQLWRVDTGEPIGKPMQHEGRPIEEIVFSPDGQSLIVNTEGGFAQLWQADTGEPLGQPIKHGEAIYNVIFSPDGQSVATGGNDGIAQLWRVEDGEPIGQPMKHSDSVLALAFHPDGQLMITGCSDGSVRLWQATTGKPLGQPVKYGDGAFSIALSPDGEWIAVQNLFWLHISKLNAPRHHIVSSRLTGGIWLPEAFNFPESCGRCLRLVNGLKGNNIHIRNINFDAPSETPIYGDPQHLLEEWQRRLALRFDEEMNIVPRWEVPSISASPASRIVGTASSAPASKPPAH